MPYDLSRRHFIKQGVLAGITLYTVPVLARFKLNLNGSSSLISPELAESWQNDGHVNHRVDAVAKVTGEKIYGRDLRAIDIDGWPNEQYWAYYIRVDRADRIFEGINLDFLPDNIKPVKVITAENLKADNVHLPTFYGVDMLVSKGRVPDYIGQTVALLIFDTFSKFDRAKNMIQFNKDVIKLGETAPLWADSQNPWGTWRITRVEGNPQGVLPDKYSALQNGVNFPPYVDHKPSWPAPNAAGTPLEKQMAIAAEIAEDFKNPDYFVLDRHYQTQFIDPMFMEPECFNGWYDAKTQTMHAIPTSQSPADIHKNASEMLATGPLAGKIKNLVIHSPYIGGGFGGKDHSILPYYGLLAAMYCDKPVRMANDRFQQFQSGMKRHPFDMHNQLAVDKKTGLFKGLISTMELDGGGRANFSSAVASVGASAIQSIYYLPKNDLMANAYVSDNVTAGSMRGFGTLQSMSAMEMMVNEVAQILNMDPIEIRKKNAIKIGQANTQGAIPSSTEHYQEILDQVQHHEIWTDRLKRKKEFEAKNPNKKFATGFAICTKDYGTGNDSPASYIELDEKGNIVMGVAAVEIGTGSQTSQGAVIAPFFGRAADTVNLAGVNVWDPLKLVETQSSFLMSEDYQTKMAQDPRWTPTIEMASSASNSAYFQSKATENAAQIIFNYGLWPAAKAIWAKLYYSDGTKYADIDFGAPEDATWVEGKLTTKGFIPLDLPTLAEYAHQHGFVTSAMVHSFNRWAWVEADFTIDGETKRYQIDALAIKYGKGANANKKALMTNDGWQLLDRQNVRYPSTDLNNAMVVYYAPCATVVDLAVEPGSGTVEIIRTHTWLDAGKVIVKELVEGQIEGGLVMGIGYALHEYLPGGTEGPGNGTWNLNRYHVPLANQVGVWNMEHTILPPTGNHDQRKGIAEVVMIPIVPAIMEALYQITNKRFYHLPVTPQDIKETFL